MDVIKIIGIALVALIIIILLRQYKPEYTIYISLLAGALILLLVMDKLTGIINLLQSLANKTSINSTFLSLLIKITGIAFLSEFAGSICKDSGEAAIANKIEIGTKIIIISMSIPIITSLLEIILKILPEKEVQMKRKIILFLVILFYIFFSTNISYSSEDVMIKEQQNEFKIQDFINNSKKYTGDFFENIDIGEILNEAIEGKVDNSTLAKRIMNLFGGEVTKNIKTIVSILVIILIHSVLKSISESLENNGISKLIYYVQYILIVTIIMSNFSDIVKIVQDTSNNLVGFMNMLVPLLITLMLATGSITTSSMVEPVILFMVNFVGNLIQNIIIPCVLILTSLVIISKISDRVQIDKLSKSIKSRYNMAFRNCFNCVRWSCIFRRNIIK